MSDIKHAIILAGGLGTRLRDVVPDLPKCMAPVAGRPFLFYVINQLRMQGIEEFVFSLGYKHELIEEYLTKEFPTLSYKTVIETEPLGTGGAIYLSCKQVTAEKVLVANGDTLYNADLDKLEKLHQSLHVECTLALKPMKNFDRYGVVEINEKGWILNFKEKQFYAQGNINGGIYLLDRNKFLNNSWPEKFSFEKEYLEKTKDLAAVIEDKYFIDIGIPEDLERAQEELKNPTLDLKDIDDSWTLFLDRDGVINLDKDGSYIFTPAEFQFLEGSPALFKKLNEKFKHVIVITNQRGVGRGLMSETDLKSIHAKMTKEIEEAGGKIDKVYYCTATHNTDPRRKPNPGMALEATKDFPDIDLRKTIMVGNNLSDMRFGRNAGVYTVFVKTTIPGQAFPHPDIDLIFPSLLDFSRAL